MCVGAATRVSRVLSWILPALTRVKHLIASCARGGSSVLRVQVHVPLCCVDWFIDCLRAYLCNMIEGGGMYRFGVMCIDYMVGRCLI